MKVAVPVERDEGLDSKLYGHFGSAPFFAVFDSETGGLDVIANDHAQHEHGQCTPSNALTAMNVKGVLCLGMGRRAISKLNAAGISVWYAGEVTDVRGAMDKFGKGGLVELTLDDACAGHEGHIH